MTNPVRLRSVTDLPSATVGAATVVAPAGMETSAVRRRAAASSSVMWGPP